MITEIIRPLPANVNYIYLDATEDKLHILVPLFHISEIPLNETNIDTLKNSTLIIGADNTCKVRSALLNWSNISQPYSIISELINAKSHLLYTLLLLRCSKSPCNNLITRYENYNKQIDNYLIILNDKIDLNKLYTDVKATIKYPDYILNLFSHKDSNVVGILLSPDNQDYSLGLSNHLFSLRRKPQDERNDQGQLTMQYTVKKNLYEAGLKCKLDILIKNHIFEDKFKKLKDQIIEQIEKEYTNQTLLPALIIKDELEAEILKRAINKVLGKYDIIIGSTFLVDNEKYSLHKFICIMNYIKEEESFSVKDAVEHVLHYLQNSNTWKEKFEKINTSNKEDYIISLPKDKINIAIQAFIGFVNVKYYVATNKKYNFGELIEKDLGRLKFLIDNLNLAFEEGWPVEKTILNVLKDLPVKDKQFFEEKSQELIIEFRQFFKYVDEFAQHMDEFIFVCNNKELNFFHTYRNRGCITLQKFLEQVKRLKKSEISSDELPVFNAQLSNQLQQVEASEEYEFTIDYKKVKHYLPEMLDLYNNKETNVNIKTSISKAVIRFLCFKDGNNAHIYNYDFIAKEPKPGYIKPIITHMIFNQNLFDTLKQYLQTPQVLENFLDVIMPSYKNSFSPEKLNNLISFFKRSFYFLIKEKENINRFKYIVSKLGIQSKEFITFQSNELVYYTTKANKELFFLGLKRGEFTFRITSSMTYWLLKITSSIQEIDKVYTAQDMSKALNTLLKANNITLPIEITTNPSTDQEITLRNGRHENEFYITMWSDDKFKKIINILNKTLSPVISCKNNIKKVISNLELGSHEKQEDLSGFEGTRYEINTLKRWILCKKYLNSSQDIRLNSHSLANMMRSELHTILAHIFEKLHFIVKAQNSFVNDDSIYIIRDTIESSKIFLECNNLDNLNTIHNYFCNYFHTDVKAYNEFVKQEKEGWEKYFNEYESNLKEINNINELLFQELKTMPKKIQCLKDKLTNSLSAAIYLLDSNDRVALIGWQEHIKKTIEELKELIKQKVDIDSFTNFINKRNSALEVDYIKSVSCLSRHPLFFKRDINSSELLNLQKTIINSVFSDYKNTMAEVNKLIDKLNLPQISSFQL